MKIKNTLERWIRQIGVITRERGDLTIAEIPVYRTVWQGSNPWVPGGSEREQRRRRLRLCGIRGPAYRRDEIFKGDLLGAIAEARSIEYPTVRQIGFAA